MIRESITLGRALTETVGGALGGMSVGALAQAAGIVDEGGGVLNWGIAGAVIVIVVVFLRFLREERATQRQYDTEREEAWLDRLESLGATCHTHHAEIAEKMRVALESHAHLEARSHEEAVRRHAELIRAVEQLTSKRNETTP